MRIFHIATLADWKQARGVRARYTTSTYGVPLAEAGFLHAARHEQVRGVLDRYYGDVTEPLVVLEIETDLLDVPWRDDVVDGEVFPHIYGPLSTPAVVRAPRSVPPFEAATLPQGAGQPRCVAPATALAVVLGTTAPALVEPAGLVGRLPGPGDRTDVGGPAVLETSHPPSSCLPDAFAGACSGLATVSSWCEWKGDASYYDLVTPARTAGRAGGPLGRRPGSRRWSTTSR